MSTWFFKKISSLAGWVSILVLFGLVIFSANLEIKDLDLWLHLASGRQIVTQNAVPHQDFLSAVVSGKDWINHEWLFQVILHGFYQYDGVDGLILLRVLMLGLTFVLLLSLGFQKERQLIPILLLLLVLLVYQLRLMLRPDIFSIVFFILFVQVLGTRLEQKSTPWILFILQVLWTNIHGFFILGPILILLTIVSELIKRHIPLPFNWREVGRMEPGEFKNLNLSFILIVLACFINPHFIEGALYPLRVLLSLSADQQIFFEHIGELQKPLAGEPLFSMGQYPFYKLMILLSVVSFVANYRKIDVGILMLWGIFLFLSLNAVRNIVFFSVASYFTILSNLHEVKFSKIFTITQKDERIRHILVIIVQVFVIVWMLQYVQKMSLRGYYDFDNYYRKSEYGGASLRSYPFKAADFLVDNNIEGQFFNDFNSGAYLLGRVHPQIKVSMDGRTELYGGEFFKRHDDIWRGSKEKFDTLVEEYQLTGAFLGSVYVPAPAFTLRHLYESKDWVLVYFDYDATIFLKNIERNQKWIDQFAIDLTQWEVPKHDLLKLGSTYVTPYRHVNRAYALISVGLLDKAQEEAKQAMLIEPQYVEAYKLLGKIYLEKKDYQKSYEYFRQAKILDARDVTARIHMALGAFYLGDMELAFNQALRCLAFDPNNAKALYLMGMVSAKYDQDDDAFLRIKQAQAADPYEFGFLLKLGDVFFEEKKYEKAKDVYTIALNKKRRTAVIHKKIGQSYYELGHMALAKKSWEEALKVNPTYESVEKLLKKIK